MIVTDGQLHTGHRERVLKEFLDRGFDEKTPPHKVLEFLLFYCVPRADTNPLAHELIDKYGSLSGVLNAPIEELADFKGLTLRGAALLKAIVPVSRIYTYEESVSPGMFTSLDDVGEFLHKKLSGYTKECACVLFMNASGKYKGFEMLSEGDIDSVGISMRTLLKMCLDKGATVIALAHNHPSGLAIPSASDAAVSERIAKTFAGVGIRLIDHIISVSDDYVSMAQSNEYAHIFNKLQY